MGVSLTLVVAAAAYARPRARETATDDAKTLENARVGWTPELRRLCTPVLFGDRAAALIRQVEAPL